MNIEDILEYLNKNGYSFIKREYIKNPDIIDDPNCIEYYHKKEHFEILLFITKSSIESKFKISIFIKDLYNDNNYLTYMGCRPFDSLNFTNEFYITIINADDLMLVKQYLDKCNKIINLILDTEKNIQKILKDEL